MGLRVWARNDKGRAVFVSRWLLASNKNPFRQFEEGIFVNGKPSTTVCPRRASAVGHCGRPPQKTLPVHGAHRSTPLKRQLSWTGFRLRKRARHINEGKSLIHQKYFCGIIIHSRHRSADRCIDKSRVADNVFLTGYKKVIAGYFFIEINCCRKMPGI